MLTSCSFSPIQAIQNVSPVWVRVYCVASAAQPENAKNATPQGTERSVMSSGSLFLPSLDFLGT